MIESDPPPEAPAAPGRSSVPDARTRVVPDLRKVPVEILSQLGWLSGVFHLPPRQSLSEFLSLAAQTVKVTRVRLSQEPDVVPFIAMRRDAVWLVAPSLDLGEEGQGIPGYTTYRDVACFLPAHMLRGSLAVPISLRLSDYLQQQSHVIVLRHCLLTSYGETANSPHARSLSTVLVNVHGTLGISEST